MIRVFQVSEVLQRGKKISLTVHESSKYRLYQAEKLDPNSPVYPSNLSSALYELGDYASCMEAILRSWALEPGPELSLRLSTRLAKALSQGVQNGSIQPSVVEQNEPAIKDLERFSTTDNVDAIQAWNIWKNVEERAGHHSDLVREAEIQILPNYPLQTHDVCVPLSIR